jgi:hypothetical protein
MLSEKNYDVHLRMTVDANLKQQIYAKNSAATHLLNDV